MLKYYPRDTAFCRFLWIRDLDSLIYYGLIALAAFLSVFLIYRKVKAFEFDLGKLKRFYIITAVIIYPVALVGSRLPDMFYRVGCRISRLRATKEIGRPSITSL